MATALKSKPGITGASALSIPSDWDSTWFRNFINNMLKGADVRNAGGTNGITVTGSIASPYATISMGAGPIVIPAGTGTTLTVNGAASSYALFVNGSSTSGQSLGEIIRAGTNSSDAAFVVQNQAGTQTFFEIFGDGHGTLGPTATSALNWSVNGNVSVLAPASGTSLSVALSPGVSTFSVGANADSVLAAYGAGSLGGIRAVYNGTSNNYYDSDSHNIRSGSGATTLATIANGGAVFGGATGGAKGAGTINCTGLFVNGVAVTVP